MEEKTKRTLIVFSAIILFSLIVLLIGRPSKIGVLSITPIEKNVGVSTTSPNLPKNVVELKLPNPINVNVKVDTINFKWDQKQFNEIKKLLKKPVPKKGINKKVYRKRKKSVAPKIEINIRISGGVNFNIKADSSSKNILNKQRVGVTDSLKSYLEYLKSFSKHKRNKTDSTVFIDY